MERVCSLLERRQESSDVRSRSIDLHQIASHQLKYRVICWDLLLIREILLAPHLCNGYDYQSHSIESLSGVLAPYKPVHAGWNCHMMGPWMAISGDTAPDEREQQKASLILPEST